MNKVQLKELLDSIVSGAQSLVKQNNTYAAAILICQCVELLGRIQSKEDDFLTNPTESSANLFRNAVMNFPALNKYNGLLLQHADYTQDGDPEVKHLAEEAKTLSDERRLKAKDARVAESKLDKVNENLFKRLTELNRKSKRFDLYKALRCGLTHNGVPGQNLGLTENLSPDVAYGVDKENDRNVLNLPKFISDVKTTVDSLSEDYEKQINADVLGVQQCEVFNPQNMRQLYGTCIVSGALPEESWYSKTVLPNDGSQADPFISVEPY